MLQTHSVNSFGLCIVQNESYDQQEVVVGNDSFEFQCLNHFKYDLSPQLLAVALPVEHTTQAT